MSPIHIEELTFSQLRVLVADKSKLGRRRFITGTPEELASRGLIPPQPAQSLAQIMEDRQHAKATKAERRKRKAEERALQQKAAMELKS